MRFTFFTYCKLKLGKDLEMQLRRFVSDELSSDMSGHGVLHAERVVQNARHILKKETGNEKITITAAYLHDCIDHKLFTDVQPQIAKVSGFLAKLQYTDSEIAQILYIMENISFSSEKSKNLSTIEAKIVCDADRLDALGAVGIIRTIEYGTTKGRMFYNGGTDVENGLNGRIGKIDKASSLAHFYEKLLRLEDLMFTQRAKTLAQERTEFMKNFLTQFYKECSL